jgi:hypothetical protein
VRLATYAHHSKPARRTGRCLCGAVQYIAPYRPRTRVKAGVIAVLFAGLRTRALSPEGAHRRTGISRKGAIQNFTATARNLGGPTQAPVPFWPGLFVVGCDRSPKLATTYLFAGTSGALTIYRNWVRLASFANYMNEPSPPRLANQNWQTIVNLLRDSSVGITRQELAAAVGSRTNSVSVMIHRLNKELTGQGWQISSVNIDRRPLRGAPGRRYRLVQLESK